MAQDKPIYEAVSEFAKLAKQLIEKYPEVFYGIDVNKISCVKVTNKDRDKKKKLFEVLAVKMPVLMDAPYGWYITVWHNFWDAFTENQKLLLISDALLHVPSNPIEDEGKIKPCDVKAHSTMVRTFKGIDWLDDSTIPHLINDDIDWIINKDEIGEQQEDQETDMKYQLCIRDEYGQNSILFTDEDLNKVIERCKREINSVNVDNALTVADKKRNWESFMVKIEVEADNVDEPDTYMYAGKDGRGIDQVFDVDNNVIKLAEVTDEVTLKMYCGKLDGEDWFVTVPSRTVRGEEDLVDSLTHESLLAKDIYYIRPV